MSEADRLGGLLKTRSSAGDAEGVRRLLDEGASVDWKDVRGCLFLCIFAFPRSGWLSFFFFFGFVNTSALLLGVLFKIFDVGEGAHIPIHWHPTPQFAQKHLNSSFGKNEAWIIIGTRPGAKAWIGWKEPLDPKEFHQLMDAQDIETLRGLMHVVEPKVGEVY